MFIFLLVLDICYFSQVCFLNWMFSLKSSLLAWIFSLFVCMLAFSFSFFSFLSFSCLLFVSIIWMLWVWAVPLRSRWRGVWWCRTLWHSGSGTKHHPLPLSHPKSPSQPAAWYVEAWHCVTSWTLFQHAWTLNQHLLNTLTTWNLAWKPYEHCSCFSRNCKLVLP